ncbi:MAG TPA: 2Fe-2S iron-sulfur cluster-binding protein [Pyrinomonadaceae bacterium]|jgi:ferredoxin
MSRNSETVFENFLRRHDETAWARALESLLPAVHEVDRNATSIWFAFFPLGLARAFEQSDEPEKLAARLLIQGKYRLEDQIDSSHAFLYGHRYWPEVKRAVAARAAQFQEETPRNETALAGHIQATARDVAAQKKVDESLVVGITAVALMTLRQVGLTAFTASPGEVRLDGANARQSPEQILRARARDDSQGLLGFLRTTDKRWTVVWNERDPSARFQMMNRQEVASAAATDKRDWSQVDPRCTVDEGPIPVQCRSASCGTCWVGVVGGAEKLTPVSPRERKAMQLFGYVETDDPQPIIRLACQAQGEGAVSIVIPTWNGVFGKYLRRLREEEAAEATEGSRAVSQ